MTRRRALSRLEEDIRDHLDRATQENIERGMQPAEARAAALRKFGNVALVEEETRAVWRRPWLDQLLRDLAFAFRILRRAPAFTTVALATLAVGIGLNTAVFSVVNSVLLRPLEYPHPERLVCPGEYDPAVGHDMVLLSDFTSWRAGAHSYSAMAAYSFQQAGMANTRGAFPVAAVFTVGDFWTLAGARPALGRLFAADESNRVVLSWDLYQKQFGADPRVVGKAVTIDGNPITVAGVLPQGFRFQFPRWWTLMHPEPIEAYLATPAGEISRRGGQVAALLKPGVTVREALAELQSLQRHLHPDAARQAPHSRLHVDLLQDQLTSGARQALSILVAAGALLLLMGSLNIASLLLARASSRRRELAIRMAVGAGRFRALRQLLVESLALASLGGAAGLLLARWIIVLLARLGPASIPRLNEASIDFRVLAFTLCISVIAGIVFAAAPGFALWRTDLLDALKDGARGSGGAFGLNIRRVLVTGELAVAVVLVTGASLLLASFLRMNARPDGFAPEKILVMNLRLPLAKYSAAMQQHYRDELLRRLESIPGVQSAGISVQPMFCCAPSFPNDALPRQHLLHLNFATSGYFRAMAMQLKRGRWLTDSDGEGAILLNESMAREAFGSADPVGRSLLVPQPAVVVGVVGDLRYARLDKDATPEIFLPFERSQIMFLSELAVRAGDVSGLAAAVRREMAAIDPTVPAYDVKTLDAALSDSIAQHRFNLFLLGTFALSAFVLALVGIYGVIAYSVAARTREIGVRVALGARRSNVIGMVVREGLTIAAAGIAVGVVAALAATRLLASLLYGIQSNDARIFGAVSAALALIALFASWWPARRAAAIDPMTALREE